MANEASIRSGLEVTIGNLSFVSTPGQFRGNVPGTTFVIAPGQFSATLAGIDVDFSSFTLAGYCLITNLDTTNFVTLGIWDGVTFYPMTEILALEKYAMRLSRDLTEEFGTGTGTTGPPINTLRIKADTAVCTVNVEAFEA